MRNSSEDRPAPVGGGADPDSPERSGDDGGAGRGISRRQALQLLGAVATSASLSNPALGWSAEQVLVARGRADAARQEATTSGVGFEPAFFTAHEYETVRVLADLVIPPDERSGGAVDAGVPEFMDFMMIDRPPMQEWMRGGLAWLDVEAQERFDRRFVDCAGDERAAILDDIAWPERAPEELSHGVAFFNRFRDLTASGFWTTEMGIEDLRYLGNRYLATWSGCPDEVLRHLGLPQP